MSTITINGQPYELSVDFDLGDLGILKRIAGLNAASFDESKDSVDLADPDVMVAFVMIAKRQAGESITREEAERVKVSEIHWTVDDAEAEQEEDEEGGPLPPSDAAVAASRSGQRGSRVTTLKAAGVRD